MFFRLCTGSTSHGAVDLRVAACAPSLPSKLAFKSGSVMNSTKITPPPPSPALHVLGRRKFAEALEVLFSNLQHPTQK